MSAEASDRGRVDTYERNAAARPLATEIAPASGSSKIEEMSRDIAAIRATLDHATRERDFKDFSYVRLIAFIAQILVAALLAIALTDVFVDPNLRQPSPVVVKLLFAGVLQLGALTAFFMSRGRRED